MKSLIILILMPCSVLALGGQFGILHILKRRFWIQGRCLEKEMDLAAESYDDSWMMEIQGKQGRDETNNRKNRRNGRSKQRK